MATLFFVTILSICTNWNIAHNDDKDEGDSGYFYAKENVIDAEWIYDPVFVNTMNSICLIISIFFMIYVVGMLMVHIGNFCLNKTTYERFSKPKKQAEVNIFSEKPE